MNNVAYFEIQVDDLQRAIKFYSEVFGWKFTKAESYDNIPVEYWRIETEGSRGGMLKREAPVPRPQKATNAFICSIEVEDFDIMSQKILANGGKVTLAKFAVTGKCWQGYFIDTEANVFGMFQVDPSAA
jgi:uncharacterized protein